MSAQDDRDRRRSVLLQAAGRALHYSDHAADLALEAMRRGDVAECRFQVERRDLWARRAQSHLSEFRKLETSAA